MCCGPPRSMTPDLIEATPATKARSVPWTNPVNASGMSARVMAVSDEQMWVQVSNGAIHRPWASVSGGLPLPSGTAVDLYFDDAGALNGWREAHSGMAINQRCLDDGGYPETYSELACHGPCGVVWRAPAADRLLEHAERCLTCDVHAVRKDSKPRSGTSSSA